MSITREIRISKGFSVLVEDEDFEWLSSFSWHYSGGYAFRYLNRHQDRSRSVSMHRMIMSAPDWLEVDHINGNKLDNRRDNLRLCTKRQNGMNKGDRVDNTSGYRGVSFASKLGKWRAQIGFNGRYYWLGLFETPEEAHAAYLVKAKEFFGDFARTT